MSKDETTTRSSPGASRLRIGMGTTIAIHAEAFSVHDSLAGIETAFAAIAQLEKLMHPARTGSDLLAVHHGVIRSEGAGDSVVELKNAALVTSDVCSAAKPTGHRGYYHGDTSAVLLDTFHARVAACDFSP